MSAVISPRAGIDEAERTDGAQNETKMDMPTTTLLQSALLESVTF